MGYLFIFIWTDRQIPTFRVYQNYAKSNKIYLFLLFTNFFMKTRKMILQNANLWQFLFLQCHQILVSWKRRLVEQIWGHFWLPLVNPTPLTLNISGWLLFSLALHSKILGKLWSASNRIMISNYNQQLWSAVMISNYDQDFSCQIPSLVDNRNVFKGFSKVA